MTVANARLVEDRTLVAKTVDDAGQVWRHDNPAELYRWVSRRNELLRTIAVAPPSAANLSRR